MADIISIIVNHILDIITIIAIIIFVYIEVRDSYHVWRERK